MKYLNDMSDDQVADILKGLKAEDKWGEFYDFTYQWITFKAKRDSRINDDSDLNKTKLKVIRECIEYYSEKEQYEKCTELKKVREAIVFSTT